jgi:hypothetical protein
VPVLAAASAAMTRGLAAAALSLKKFMSSGLGGRRPPAERRGRRGVCAWCRAVPSGLRRHPKTRFASPGIARFPENRHARRKRSRTRTVLAESVFLAGNVGRKIDFAIKFRCSAKSALVRRLEFWQVHRNRTVLLSHFSPRRPKLFQPSGRAVAMERSMTRGRANTAEATRTRVRKTTA